MSVIKTKSYWWTTIGYWHLAVLLTNEGEKKGKRFYYL